MRFPFRENQRFRVKQVVIARHSHSAKRFFPPLAHNSYGSNPQLTVLGFDLGFMVYANLRMSTDPALASFF